MDREMVAEEFKSGETTQTYQKITLCTRSSTQKEDFFQKKSSVTFSRHCEGYCPTASDLLDLKGTKKL